MTPKETTMAISVAITLVCGFASFAQGVREGRNQKSVFDLASEISKSFIAGVMAYILGTEQGYSVNWIYFMVLVSANNAAEAKAKAWEQISNLFTLFKPGGKK
ncbi:hypothetical protein [Citrobacter werkmanii]|uniref:hypothetical protein n=1 Tax=Citrobacter werkmanii TaxID=67827 RepID=UPI0037C83B42